MSTLTKEWLQKTIAELEEERDATPGAVNEDAAMALAAMKLALASLEAPSADDVSDAELNAALLLHRLKVEGHSQLSDAFRAGFKYARRTAPPTPVSVPDERYQHLSELYHAQEKRLFKLAQRIKGPSFDKYAYSPSQAIDVLESAIFGERKDEDCRAAMLQGSEPVTTAYKLPANVIDALEKALQAMSFMGDTLNDMDAVCEEDIEYVTPAFDAVRKVLEGNSPVIPDGWVACSERMPSAGEQVLAYRPDAPESNDPLIKMATYVGGSAHGHGFDCYCKPTHWMPLPAAPQQED
ncbi:TPA: DUF551 domain-containing protein [Enterobacter hormaechei subsp. hoffmannii]|nr:DUF551 domain-containing protein [Enterobacter hormaechei subsp. hoffmannii]